jgi:hypothetical protein
MDLMTPRRNGQTRYHNDTDSPLYYVQLGQLPLTADINRSNSICMLFYLLECTKTDILSNYRTHIDILRQASSRGQMTDDQLETQHSQ